MNKIFCSECGHKHEYASQKPKFCSECGAGIDGVVRASKSRYVDEDEEEEDEEKGEFAGGIPKIVVDLNLGGPRGVTFGQMAEERIAPSEKSRRPPGKNNIDEMTKKSQGVNRIEIG